jgi:ATP-dependent Clp protease ATP-binding subunit ClpC
MFERFTDRTRRTLVLAQEEQRLLGHAYLGTEHLLLGLIAERRSISAKTLDYLGITLEPTRIEVEELRPDAIKGEPGFGQFSSHAKTALEMALRQCLERGDHEISPEHLLLGILDVEDCTGVAVLQNMRLDPFDLRRMIVGEMKTGGSGLRGIERVRWLAGPHIVYGPQREGFEEAVKALCGQGHRATVRLFDGAIHEVLLLRVEGGGLIVRSPHGDANVEDTLRVDDIVELRLSSENEPNESTP